MTLISSRCPDANLKNPAAQGFRMPAEWERHACCWMAWPATLRKGKLAKALVNLAGSIARFEPVRFAGRGRSLIESAIPADDIWIRDTGPTFLRDGAGEIAATVWLFNAWGGKEACGAADRMLAARLAGHIGIRCFAAPLVCEDGAIHTDGAGTLLTTESVLLNPNRNPSADRRELEELLRAYTSTRKVIWLPGSAYDHVTDGHVDAMAAFVRPGVVKAELAASRDDPESEALRENCRALQLATDAAGRRLEVLTVTRPPWQNRWSDDFAASYVNFYLPNGAVILPRFNHPASDLAAAETIRRAFPKRTIVQVEIDVIASLGGGIHCVTQQQPSGSP